jgi:hypothetical protein
LEVAPVKAPVEEALRGKRVVIGEKGERKRKVEKVKKAKTVEAAPAVVMAVEGLAWEVQA